MADIKKYSGGSQTTIKEINISVVLDRIRSQDNTTRSSLSRELNLSLPTVSRTVDTLIDRRLVLEAGSGESTGGKKPTLLKFNKGVSYVIGIEVDIHLINVILADFSGNIVQSINMRFKKNKKPEEMTGIVLKYIDRIIEKSKISNKKIKAIALGIPAYVNNKTGIIGLCPTIPAWEGINLAKVLSKKTKKEVIVDNMINMSILGERRKGIARDAQNAVYIGIGTGIGAGILINGKIYRGNDGTAGEIGYIYIDRDISKNKSGEYGQFEYLCSDLALVRETKGKQNSREINNIRHFDFKSEIENPENKEIIIKIISDLALGISNIVSILNPELVIVRGELFYYSDLYLNMLKKKVDDLLLFKTRIVNSSLKEKAVSVGAVVCGIQYLEKKILSPLFH